MPTEARGYHGRFLPGNPGNPHARGRPRRDREQTYLEATISAVSPAAWRQVVFKALQQALNGDAKAREFLRKVLIGDEPADMLKAWERLDQLARRLDENDRAREQEQPELLEEGEDERQERLRRLEEWRRQAGPLGHDNADGSDT